MATDADVPRAADRESSGERGDPVAESGDRRTRADRGSASGAVESAPRRSVEQAQSLSSFGRVSTRRIDARALYLVRIAVLEARVAELEAAVASKERDLQHVVDRYEHVLDGRGVRREAPLVDAAGDGDRPAVDAGDSGSRESGDADDGAAGPDRGSSDAGRESDGAADTGPLDRVRALLR